MVKKLRWDSDFFGYNIGRIDCYDPFFTVTEVQNIDSFDLVYLFAHQDIKSQKSLPTPFKKIIFSTKLDKSYSNPITETQNIVELDLKTVTQDEKKHLVNLSYQSGIYSRFKLDKNFSEIDFKKLYSKWITNSISQKIADQIIVSKNDKNRINGFVTLSHGKHESSIGLIAVSHNSRRKGIGGKLILSCKYLAQCNNKKKLNVATQMKNEKACGFYLKSGFKKSKSIDIYHLWQK